MRDPVSDATVFEATLGALADRGYARATTRAIASAAGVNEVTLFRRYGDKRRLVLAAIHAEVSALAGEALEPTDDVEADLVRVVEYYAGLYRRRDGLVAALLLEGAQDPDVAAVIAEPLAAVSRVGELIAHHQAAGTLAPEPPGAAVQALLAPLLLADVVRRITGTDPEAPDPAAIVHRYLHGRLAP